MAAVRRRTIALVLTVALAGCEPSNLLLPMEPAPESVAAPVRQLTLMEKEWISQAVAQKLGGSEHREFKWAPLVLRSQGRVFDYCGMVSGGSAEGRDLFHQFYAKLDFEPQGQLKVNAESVDQSDNFLGVPTASDSLCAKGGYNRFR